VGEAKEEGWARVREVETLVMHKLPLLEHKKIVSLPGSAEAIIFGSAA
jgi:hypothetical protein